MSEGNLLPRFYQLLDEAHETSQAVDMFDLDSKNQESVKEWKRLKENHSKAVSELLTYIKNNPSILPQVLSLTQ